MRNNYVTAYTGHEYRNLSMGQRTLVTRITDIMEFQLIQARLERHLILQREGARERRASESVE